MKHYEDLSIIKNAKSVCLIGHTEPDADALASMYVFKKFLMKQFHLQIVDIFAETDSIAESCKPILADEKINIQTQNIYDFAIAMDSSSLDRLGSYSELFLESNHKLVIDHHATDSQYGDINYIENISSTCELVYKIVSEFEYIISSEEYARLYAGIITDTNNLSVGNITETSFILCGKAVKDNDLNSIYSNFFANSSLKNMQILAKAIENVKNYENNQIIISHITHEESQILKIVPDDYIGIANRLATITNSKLICFIYPQDNHYYVSLRARKGYNISNIAQKYGGGGHAGASAFDSNLPIKEIESIILKEFENELKTVNIPDAPPF